MKKSHLVILVAAMVLLSVFVWVFQSGFTGTVSEIVQFGVVFLVVTFGFYIGYRRLNSEKRGEPAEDELSRRMLRKASSLSFYVSLYIWLIVLYLTEESKLEGHTLVACGILAMAASFVACWLFIKWRGLSNE